MEIHLKYWELRILIINRLSDKERQNKDMVNYQPVNRIKRNDRSRNRKSNMGIFYPIEIKGEVIGAIYFESKMENVFAQMKEINQIFITGTAIALVITAIIGILLAQNDYRANFGYEKTSTSDGERELFPKG